jgi:hypothetical protein
MLAVIALVHGDFSGFSLAQVSLRSWLAFGYLVVFGSLVGFTSSRGCLKRQAHHRLDVAFVNPSSRCFWAGFSAGNSLARTRLYPAHHHSGRLLHHGVRQRARREDGCGDGRRRGELI